MIVNLNPRGAQHGWVTVPLATLALDAGRKYEMEDLLDGARYGWQGDRAYVRLDPAERVGHILKPVEV